MLQPLHLIVIFVVLLFSLSACVQDEVENRTDVQLEQTLLRISGTQGLDYYQLPDENDLAAIPAGKGNPLTADKVRLGKMLFFETGLARDAIKPINNGTYSCSTCHVPTAGFMAGRMQGIADGAFGFGSNGESRAMREDYREQEIDAQGNRPLSMLGVAYVTNSMWSGLFGANNVNVGTEHLWGVVDPGTEHNKRGLDGLESQNIEGTIVHRMRVDDYVLDTLGYRQHFDAAFGDWPTNARYGRVALSFALSAYIRTLLPNQAPWQQWLRGDSDAMTDAQKRGALLFFGKAGCYRCHNGPALNSMEFHALGVNDLHQVGGLKTGPEDVRTRGRGGFTQRPADMYKFKVPQLYNLAESPFYFHGSSKYSLHDVVRYFNNAVPENPNVPVEQISPYFHPLNLTEQEVTQLTDFLANGLRDPNLLRYVPTDVLSGNCMPNNDAVSRRQLGCD